METLTILGDHSAQTRPSNAPRRDPERRKQALINATLDTISEVGVLGTTISKVIERAGLSRGMINLHFGSKNNLLTETAKAFSDDYYKKMDDQLHHCANDPESIVMAVVKADLGELLMNERSTRIWHAFRGASGANAGIARYSSTRDKRLRETIRSAFEIIAAEYAATDDVTSPRDSTFAVLALLEGMWVDYLSNPNAFSRADAVSIVHRVIAGLYPRHFQYDIKS